MEKLNIKKITSFLNTQYKEYSRYSIENRALECVCDGLKPGARKILNAAFVGTLKDGKTTKLLSLVGGCPAEAVIYQCIVKLPNFAH